MSTIDVLFTAGGTKRIPPEIAQAISRVPRRKNGYPDRRYAIGRKYLSWEHRQNQIALVAYIEGCDYELEPFNP